MSLVEGPNATTALCEVYRRTGGVDKLWHESHGWESSCTTIGRTAPSNDVIIQAEEDLPVWCDWYGIECLATERFKQKQSLNLWLNSSGLSGPLSAFDKVFASPQLSLHKLRLDGNDLTGTISSAISGQRSLEVFSATDNWLVGTLPQNISALSQLRELSLGFNALSGVIGDVAGKISGLPKLTAIDLRYNRLSGTISSVDLTQATSVKTAWNRLSCGTPQVEGTAAASGENVDILSGGIFSCPIPKALGDADVAGGSYDCGDHSIYGAALIVSCVCLVAFVAAALTAWRRGLTVASASGWRRASKRRAQQAPWQYARAARGAAALGIVMSGAFLAVLLPVFLTSGQDASPFECRELHASSLAYIGSKYVADSPSSDVTSIASDGTTATETVAWAVTCLSLVSLSGLLIWHQTQTPRSPDDDATSREEVGVGDVVIDGRCNGHWDSDNSDGDGDEDNLHTGGRGAGSAMNDVLVYSGHQNSPKEYSATAGGHRERPCPALLRSLARALVALVATLALGTLPHFAFVYLHRQAVGSMTLALRVVTSLLLAAVMSVLTAAVLPAIVRWWGLEAHSLPGLCGHRRVPGLGVFYVISLLLTTLIGPTAAVAAYDPRCLYWWWSGSDVEVTTADSDEENMILSQVSFPRGVFDAMCPSSILVLYKPIWITWAALQGTLLAAAWLTADSRRGGFEKALPRWPKTAFTRTFFQISGGGPRQEQPPPRSIVRIYDLDEAYAQLVNGLGLLVSVGLCAPIVGAALCLSIASTAWTQVQLLGKIQLQHSLETDRQRPALPEGLDRLGALLCTYTLAALFVAFQLIGPSATVPAINPDGEMLISFPGALLFCAFLVFPLVTSALFSACRAILTAATDGSTYTGTPRSRAGRIDRIRQRNSECFDSSDDEEEEGAIGFFGGGGDTLGMKRPLLAEDSLLSLPQEEGDILERMRRSCDRNAFFAIKRSMNTNVVVYAANVGEDGSLDADCPVFAFWAMRELLSESERRRDRPPPTEDLTLMERKTAYGFEVTPDRSARDGHVCVSLSALGDREIVVFIDADGIPTAETDISGRPGMRLRFVAVECGTNMIGLPTVKHVDLHGTDPSSGLPVTERKLG